LRYDAPPGAQEARDLDRAIYPDEFALTSALRDFEGALRPLRQDGAADIGRHLHGLDRAQHLQGQAGNKLVLIGRNLDRAQLRSRLEACLMPAPAALV
jgi:Cobalamin synthesis protein cobW C-terminal domain